MNFLLEGPDKGPHMTLLWRKSQEGKERERRKNEEERMKNVQRLAVFEPLTSLSWDEGYTAAPQPQPKLRKIIICKSLFWKIFLFHQTTNKILLWRQVGFWNYWIKKISSFKFFLTGALAGWFWRSKVVKFKVLSQYGPLYRIGLLSG